MTTERKRKPSSILEQITEKREKEEARKQSETEALRLLPEFKAQLDNLIIAKVPAPITEERIATRFSDGMFDFDYRNCETKLLIELRLRTLGLHTTRVKITTSNYPGTKNWISGNGNSYEVDAEDLDSVLIIDGEKVNIQSKERVQPTFDKHTGSKIPSYPSWERPALAEEIEQYSELLKKLDEEGTVIEASTPKIITWDYSQLHAGVKHSRRDLHLSS